LNAQYYSKKFQTWTAGAVIVKSR